jgi:hypothetical protein
LGLLQELHEARLIGISEKLLGQLSRSGGVLNYLHRLNARKLVKKPAAASVYQHGMTLKLQKLQDSNSLFLAQRPLGLLR